MSDMTREEAIEIVNKGKCPYPVSLKEKEKNEALDMAISALSENKGEWIHVIDSYYEDGTQKESHWECSKCGSGRSGWGEFKFCPDCGADMRGEE